MLPKIKDISATLTLSGNQQPLARNIETYIVFQVSIPNYQYITYDGI